MEEAEEAVLALEVRQTRPAPHLSLAPKAFEPAPRTIEAGFSGSWRVALGDSLGPTCGFGRARVQNSERVPPPAATRSCRAPAGGGDRHRRAGDSPPPRPAVGQLVSAMRHLARTLLTRGHGRSRR
jgi:hypothetical protein